MKKLLLFLFITLFAAFQLNAATITSTATGGVWATGGTWVGGVAPASTDQVIIATTGANSVTLNATTTCAGLTINGSAILTVGAFAINVNGATSVTGTLNISSTTGTKAFNGDITINSGGIWNETAAATVTCSGSFTNNATTFTASAGTHTFSGATKTFSGSTTTSIANVTFTGAYTNSGTLTVATLLTVTGVTLTNNGTITATTALSGTGGVTQGTTGVLNLPGTFGISALTTSAAGNTVNYSGASQQIKTGTYSNLTLSNAAGAYTTAAAITITVNGTLTTAAGCTLTMNASCTLNGTLATVSNGGTIKTPNAGISSGINWGNSGTIEFTGTSLIIPTGTYFNLKSDNSNSAGGNLVVNGTLTTTGTLDMGTNTLTGTLGTVTNSGTIKTSNTSGIPISSGINWGSAGTVEFGTSGQSVPAGTFFNLKSDNSNSAGGNLVVNGTLTTTGTLNMGTNTLTGTLVTVTNSGTIKTSNTSGTPIASGINWGSAGTVEFGTSGQSVPAGTYFSLTFDNTSGTNTALGNLVVNGTLTTTSGGTLDMGTNTLTGTLSTVTNNGTIKTSNTSSTPIPTGKTWGGTVNYAVTSGSQTVMAGTYSTLTLSNTSGTNTASGILTDNGTLTIPAGGTLNMSTYALSGTLSTVTNNGTIITSSTANPAFPSGETWGGTIEYAVLSGGQYIPAGTYSNLKLDNTSGSNTVLGSLTISGNLNGGSSSGLTIGTSLTLTLSTSTGNQCGPINIGGFILIYNGAGTLSCSSITFGSSGILTFNTNGTLNCTGDVTASSGNQINCGAGTFSCGNIGFTSSCTISIGTGTLSCNNLTYTSGNTLTFTGAGTLNIGGNLAIGTPPLNFTPSSGTVNYNGAAQIVRALSTGYNNLTLSGTGSKTTTGITVNGILSMEGDATVSLSAPPTYGAAATLQYKGTASRTATVNEFPNAFAGSGGVIINQGAANTITLNANKTALAGPLNIKSGTLDLLTYTINRVSNTLTLTIAGTLKLGGTTGGQTGSNFPSGFTTLTMTGGAVEYSVAAGGQTIYATPAYNNLKLDNTSGTNTAGNNLIVNGILTTTATGTLDMSTYTLGGTLTSISNGGTIKTSNTSSTPIPTGYTWGGTVNYAAGISQTINNGIYSTLNISNSAGVTLTGDATVNTSLNFTNGKITTGANKIILGSSASISGAGTGKYVYGNLLWNIPTGTPSSTFTIGDASNYAPVTVAFTNVTVAGTLTGSVTGADHSLISTSGINAAKSVNHAWTLTNTGITFSSGTATVTLNWVGVGTDADAGSTPANYIVAKLDGSTWTNPTVGAKTSTSIGVTGITSFSDFQVGEAATIPSDYFRSVTTGIWSTASTWQSSSDNITWGPAALAPTNLANSITIQNPNTVTVDVDGQTASSIIIVGTLTNSASNNLNVSGNWTNNGTFTPVTGTITFTGTSQTIDGSASTTFNNLTLSNNGLKTFSTIPAVNGILSMEGTATASAAPTYGGSAILQYKGSGSQTTGSELPASINNLTIYNPNGVALSGSTIVNGTFALTSGNISLGTNNLTVSSISGGSSASYVITDGIGTLIQNVGTSPVTFPIGFVASDYTPITFSNTGTLQNYNVRIRSVTPSLSTSGLDRQWIVKETNAGTTILSLVTLTWTATSAYTLGNPPSCDMVENITGSVDPYYAIKTGLDGTSSSVTTGSMSYPLGDITTGLYITLVGQVGLVPVELSTFASAVNGRNISLNWETKTEKNSDRFVIERTKIDASAVTLNWETVTSVKAAVLSNSPKQYSFTDKNLQSGIYQYRLKMIDNDGSFAYSKVVEADITLPKNFELSQNYPNPFNPTTKINYSLPNDSKVTLEVYNIIGERVAQLVNEEQSGGYYVVNFGTSSNNISSGIYIYKLTAVDNTGKNFSSIKKMMLLK